jgi:hypothetical protein
MLKVLATATRETANSRTARGKRSLMSAASPFPLERPSRAAVSWTAEASGREMRAVQRRPYPNAAPTWE